MMQWPSPPYQGSQLRAPRPFGIDFGSMIPKGGETPEVVTKDAAKDALKEGRLSDAIAIMEAMKKKGELGKRAKIS